jgi:hypothetical protein
LLAVVVVGVIRVLAVVLAGIKRTRAMLSLTKNTRLLWAMVVLGLLRRQIKVPTAATLLSTP